MSFTESLRYDYPLIPDSYVMDIGVYLGDFTCGITSAYGCNVFGFEPIKSFFDYSKSRFVANPKVKLFNYALGGKHMYMQPFYKAGDWTGRFPREQTESAEKEICQIVALHDAMKEFGFKEIDLIKINCEGSEYELLNNMLEWKLQTHFKNIQIQFHDFMPSAEMMRGAIHKELSKTHELTWCEPFIWENWRLKA